MKKGTLAEELRTARRLDSLFNSVFMVGRVTLQMIMGAPVLASLTDCHEKFASILQVKGCFTSSANPMVN